jgi:predicted ester cyclase
MDWSHGWEPSLTGEHEPPADQVRRLVEEACNAGNLAALEQALAPPAHPSGPELKLAQHLPQLLAAFRAAVPDAQWTIEEQITQGEAVATRLSVNGRFFGPLLGLAPPGRRATLTGVVISRFAGGYLVGLWLQADLLGLLLQLGVLPPLDLAQAVALAQVNRVGMVMAGGADLEHGPTRDEVRHTR